MMQSTEIVELSSAPRVAESAQSEVRLIGTRYRRTKRFVLLALVVILLSPSAYICWQARDGSQLGFWQDDGLYLAAAKSLVEKGKYIIPSLPGHPYQTKYPPLYPLLLAVLWKLDPGFPANLKWFVLLNWCLWAAFLAVSFIAFRRLELSCAARWGALTLLAWNTTLLFLTIHFMSEALFSTFVIAAILLAEQASKTTRRPVAIAVCSAAVAGCAFLTKTAALPLTLTVPAVFLIRRQYARALAFTGVLAPIVIAWIVWAGSHRLHSNDPVLLYYTDYFGFYKFNVHWQDLPALVRVNLPFLVHALAGTGPNLPEWLEPASIITLVLCAIGTARLLLKARYLHTGAFMAVYTAQMIAWNFSPNLRFLYPLLPFVAAGFVTELFHLTAVIRRSLRGRWVALGYVFPGLVLCCLFSSLLTIPQRQTIEGIVQQIAKFRHYTAQRRAAYAWINEHLPINAQFAAYDDVSLYLYTGRKGIRNEVLTGPYLAGDVAGMDRPITGIADFARNHRLKYLLWSEDDYAVDGVLNDRSLRQRLLRQNQGLSVLYTCPGIRIYDVGIQEP